MSIIFRRQSSRSPSVAFSPAPWLSLGVVGTILNGTAIIAGGIIGKTAAKDLSPANQNRLKVLLGLLIVYVGLSTTWSAARGSFGYFCKQIGIAMLAIIIGNVIGKLAGIQKSLNKIGSQARDKFVKGGAAVNNRFSEGFITCSLLFCVGPMAILGALQDGISGNYKTLAIKSVMDGLATMAFVKTFGWGAAFAAIPVVLYQGGITVGAHYLEPILREQSLLDALNTTGGLLICCISLIIFELKKVPIADYLPSLAVAPLLAWMWR